MKAFLFLAFSAASLSALDNGLARLPHMGWNSWYNTGYNLTLAMLKTEADSLVGTGLRDLGYNILWMDAGWTEGRNPDGTINPKFSISELAEYCHARNLKLGIYTDAGPTGCGVSFGSADHIQADMDQFVAWNCDAVKVDFCGGPGSYSTAQQAYEAYRDAINDRMIYNICIWGTGSYQTWAPRTGHSWRTGGDIGSGYLGNLDANMAYPEISGPGGYNDPDYLNGLLGAVANRSQFSMWSMMASPLILGFKVSLADSALLNIYRNPEVIALNQDSLCYQCRNVAGDGHYIVYKKNLQDGNIAVALFNRDNVPYFTTQTDTFSPVTASKVRLFITSTQSNGGGACPSISEFEVYNGTEGINLALNKAASASSEYSASYAAGKANDGDSETRWNSAACASGDNEWLEIDFGTTTTFDRVVWKQAFNRIVSYSVQYWNGTGWVEAATNPQGGPYGLDITVNWSELGISGDFQVRDLWEHADKGYYSDSYTARAVPPLGCALIKIFTSQTKVEALPLDEALSLEASPNPFNPAVTLTLAGKQMKDAGVKVFDPSGRLIADLSKGLKQGRAVWNATGLASGVYMVIAKQGKRSITKRIVYSK